ncbi:MAG: hypothetical protein R3F54_31995, partial [Alphaproteobacteria bacterium]
MIAIAMLAGWNDFITCYGNASQMGAFSDWAFGCQAVPSFSFVLFVPAGHTLLFAVGAWPPHDGV